MTIDGDNSKPVPEQITESNGIKYKKMHDSLTGIRALGGGGANLLVGASGAGIRLPRLLRLRSRAI